MMTNKNRFILDDKHNSHEVQMVITQIHVIDI